MRGAENAGDGGSGSRNAPPRRAVSPRRPAPPAARTSRGIASANPAPRNSPRAGGRPATAPRALIGRSQPLALALDGFGGKIADAERGGLVEGLDAFFDKGLDAFFAA